MFSAAARGVQRWQRELLAHPSHDQQESATWAVSTVREMKSLCLLMFGVPFLFSFLSDTVPGKMETEASVNQFQRLLRLLITNICLYIAIFFCFLFFAPCRSLQIVKSSMVWQLEMSWCALFVLFICCTYVNIFICCTLYVYIMHLFVSKLCPSFGYRNVSYGYHRNYSTDLKSYNAVPLYVNMMFLQFFILCSVIIN